MKFGVFDHVDRGASSLAELYESRLKLAEIYDRSGFYAYHVAEHHATPLGMASVPGVLLAAIAQRTTRLRFGPLVYILTLSHPLRILEEICMLDQMSNGRLEAGRRARRLALRGRLFRRRSASVLQDLHRGLSDHPAGPAIPRDQFRGRGVPVEERPGRDGVPAKAASADLVRDVQSQCGAMGRAEQYQHRLQRAVGVGARRHRSLSPGMAAGQWLERRDHAEDGIRPPHRRRRNLQGGVRDRASARSPSGTTA